MALWKPDPDFLSVRSHGDVGAAGKHRLRRHLRSERASPMRCAARSTSIRSRAATARSSGALEMPNVGDELHHFGWNACSAALCPYAPHPHIERRYLVVPGLRSSRIHIIDTKPDPREARRSSK